MKTKTKKPNRYFKKVLTTRGIEEKRHSFESIEISSGVTLEFEALISKNGAIPSDSRGYNQRKLV